MSLENGLTKLCHIRSQHDTTGMRTQTEEEHEYHMTGPYKQVFPLE